MTGSRLTLRAEHRSLEGYLRERLPREQWERVLLPSFNQWAIATAVVAELSATLHRMGAQPTIALWADETPVRDVGWTTSGRLSRILRSRGRDARVRAGLEAFGLPASAFVRPPIAPWQPGAALPEPEALYRSALRQLTYRGAPLGRALLQVHPDRNTPVSDDHLWPRRWVDACIRSYAYVFDQVVELIVQRGSTAVAVFNGRFLHDAAAAAAARHMGVPVLSYDFGGNDTDFDLTVDHTHDWSALQRRMLHLYEDWDPSERERLGARWFEERRKHVDPRNTPFTESQNVGTGIEKPPGKRLVVFFSSSGDEISELELDWAGFFFGQEGALMAVAEICRELPNVVLVVRTHPHKRHKPKRDVEDWHRAVEEASPDIHIDEFSPVDSYTLMDQADVVITYGSTTGVEAAYCQRPVAVLGPSAYDVLGCAFRAKTRESLKEFIASPFMGSDVGALAYGLMMLRRGFLFHHVTPQGEIGGTKLIDSNKVILKVSDVLQRFSHWRLRWRRAQLSSSEPSAFKAKGKVPLKGPLSLWR